MQHFSKLQRITICMKRLVLTLYPEKGQFKVNILLIFSDLIYLMAFIYILFAFPPHKCHTSTSIYFMCLTGCLDILSALNFYYKEVRLANSQHQDLQLVLAEDRD